MRTRLATCGSGLLVLLAAVGCARAAADTPIPVSPVATEWPAAVAGGACQLLDYAVIETAVGIRFDVAAASRQGDTYTCVLQRSKASRPDLVLAVTATSADPAIFRSAVVPKNATKVTGLGRAAYRIGVAAGKSQGQAVEVGWLSGDQRLISLRYTFPLDADSTAVGTLTPKLVELAKKVDTTSI